MSAHNATKPRERWGIMYSLRMTPLLSHHTFIVGHDYSRRDDIHAVFGGGSQSGISPSRKAPFIFLFTGGSGKTHGYADEWVGEIFKYYGEGQTGDMKMVRGNRALLEHTEHGKIVLLFESLGKSQPVRFLGEFAYNAHEVTPAPDTNGDVRQAIVFYLRQTNVESGDDISPATLNQPLEELRKKAYAAISAPEAKTRQVLVRTRCNDVKAYALKRSNGHCECCGVEAPFLTKHGLPYLEVHHIQKLSDFGLDSPINVAALTPNCHRKIHQGIDGFEIDKKLKQIIKIKEINGKDYM